MFNFVFEGLVKTKDLEFPWEVGVLECSRGYMVHCIGEKHMGLVFTDDGEDGCQQNRKRNKEGTSG